RAQALTVIERILALRSGQTLPTDHQAVAWAEKKAQYGSDHIALHSGKIYDIDDLSIVDTFYELYKDTLNVSRYESVEQLRKHIKGAREIVEGIRVVIDREKEQFVITIPEFDKDKYYISLTTLDDQYHDSGVYTADFHRSA